MVKALEPGTHYNKIGICSLCGKKVKYGKRYQHWKEECHDN